MHDGILTVLEQLTNALRTGMASPGAHPYIDRAFKALAELRELHAALPPLSEVEARIGALEKAFADLHAARAPRGPASVQKAVAGVEVPPANAS